MGRKEKRGEGRKGREDGWRRERKKGGRKGRRNVRVADVGK